MKKFILLSAAVVAVAIVVIVAAALFTAGGTEPAPGDNNSTDITVNGTLACLPHKDTSGPQTLECAFGLRTDDNRYYALKGLPQTSVTNGINSRLQVHGTLSQPDSNDIYNTVGTITVQSAIKQ